MSDELCEVTVAGMGQDRFGYEFVLLEDDRGRQLPIWIGQCEAISITYKLRDVPLPRPMTYDLLALSVEKLGGRITRLVVDDLWQNIYYAKLCVDYQDEEVQLDCRPSDGLALALRAGAAILVREDVMLEGQVPQPLSGEEGEDAPDND